MTNKIDYNKWQNWSWKSEDRYYHLYLTQNLFGEWLIIRKWGGLRTRIHGSKTHYFHNLDEVGNSLKQIQKRRIARGYNLIE
jgi:hypothetical protein